MTTLTRSYWISPGLFLNADHEDNVPVYLLGTINEQLLKDWKTFVVNVFINLKQCNQIMVDQR